MKSYEGLFDEENITIAIIFVSTYEKYGKVSFSSFEDVEKWEVLQHHRNRNNFWKDVVRFIVNKNRKDLHRFTIQKYATFCYHDFRNKRDSFRQIFDGKLRRKISKYADFFSYC